jgi:flagellar hook-basal body complex protein FliE
MTFPITSVTLPVQPFEAFKGIADSAAPGAFRSVLNSAIQNVEHFRLEADDKVGKFLSGEGEELHKVVMATQQADLSFELFQQVRNKVVQAYQEVMRMQM